MAIAAELLPEFDQEMQKTRKALERVPDDKSKFDWKPHAKSMPFLKLAGHVANIPEWTVYTLQRDVLDLATDGKQQQPTSKQEVLEIFDKHVKAARAELEKASDEHLMQPWSLKMGEQTFFTMPRATVIRSMVMNHSIHHRSQLCVYLRLHDIPVPALYGPSADETAF